MVEGDAFRLKQVLFNIIGNAIKFTNEGGVKVDADLQALDGKAMLKISVADTGIGIDPKHLPYIFDEFTQVPGAKGTSGRHEGSGLGTLPSYARSLELHGSTPGSGKRSRAKAPPSASRFPITPTSNTIIIHQHPRPLCQKPQPQFSFSDAHITGRCLCRV